MVKKSFKFKIKKTWDITGAEYWYFGNSENLFFQNCRYFKSRKFSRKYQTEIKYFDYIFGNLDNFLENVHKKPNEKIKFFLFVRMTKKTVLFDSSYGS